MNVEVVEHSIRKICCCHLIVKYNKVGKITSPQGEGLDC